MTRGPTRLKNDVDFQWETGCNLADEELLVGAYDHAALRSRIVTAALATGAAATTAVIVGNGVPAVTRATGWTVAAAWKPIVGVTAGAAILAGTYWLGLQSRPAPESTSGVGAVPTPITAPAVLDVAPEPAAEPVRTEEVIPPPAASLSTGAPRAAPQAAPPAIAPPVALEPPPVDATIETPPPMPGSAVRGSDLPGELWVMDIAAEALNAGDYVRAEQMYERYLAEYPSGRSVPEATMGLLEARFGRGDAAGAEELAKKMQGDPAFLEEREEILRFRAESLVQLDRCGEALPLVEGLSDRSAARDVTRACRHREGD
jgi:hypothetical protein